MGVFKCWHLILSINMNHIFDENVGKKNHAITKLNAHSFFIEQFHHKNK